MDTKWGLRRHFLCAHHAERWPKRRRDVSPRATSIEAHPSTFDSIGGRVSFEIWTTHPDACGCEHCVYVNGHMDDAVDRI